MVSERGITARLDHPRKDASQNFETKNGGNDRLVSLELFIAHVNFNPLVFHVTRPQQPAQQPAFVVVLVVRMSPTTLLIEN